MNILALDTSGATATVAISKDGYLTGELSIRNGLTHSQKIIPMMESLMSMLDLKPKDIDLLAVANGPGSFTGLRIGVVTMKAFAYAMSLPLMEIPTLMALAYTLGEQDGVICPVMDARNRQVFTGLYRISGDTVTQIREDCGIPIEELVDILRGLDTDIHFVGDAVRLYRDYIREQGIRAFFASDELFTCRASAVARLAWLMRDKGSVADAFSAAPNYLRKSQAERMKESHDGDKP